MIDVFTYKTLTGFIPEVEPIPRSDLHMFSTVLGMYPIREATQYIETHEYPTYNGFNEEISARIFAIGLPYEYTDGDVSNAAILLASEIDRVFMPPNFEIAEGSVPSLIRNYKAIAYTLLWIPMEIVTAFDSSPYLHVAFNVVYGPAQEQVPEELPPGI
jgi:hypothetical protein